MKPEGTPAPRAELLTAHQQFLDAAAAFLRSRNPDPKTMTDQIMAALAGRVLQIGYSLQTLCEQDAAADAEPLARTMMSGAASLMFLRDFDSDRRTYLFAKHSQRIDTSIRAKFLSRMSQRDAKRLTRDSETAWKPILTEYRKLGVREDKLGAQPTWHGLSEQVIFELMGWGEWYDLYGLYSGTVHLGFSSLRDHLVDLLDEDRVKRSSGDPFLVLLTSRIAVTESLAQLNLLFKWDRRDDIKAVDSQFDAALTTYAQTAS